jgi:hypothetical protein
MRSIKTHVTWQDSNDIGFQENREGFFSEKSPKIEQIGKIINLSSKKRSRFCSKKLRYRQSRTLGLQRTSQGDQMSL